MDSANNNKQAVMSFIDELKRRNVFRIGVAYVIVAWLLLQVADVVLPTFRSPEWVMQAFTFLLILSFPLALLFAWAFEITPEGIKLEKDVVRSESITHLTGRKFDFAIIGLLALALVFVVADNYVLRDEPAPVVAEQTELAVQPLEKSIAVLPFANRSASEADAFFVDGLHDDLITHIAKIGAIKTISRTSVMPYRDTDKSLPQIAEELGVATIMEGSVQRAADTIRINVQLIDAATDEHLWAQTYDRQLTASNMFAIQSEIASAVAEALRATLTPAEQERIESVPTENMAALEAYFRGRQRMATRTSVGFIDAIEHFQRAITLDPNFALAYVGLAITYAIQSAYTGLPPAEQVAKAEAPLAQAFALDDGLGEAYALLGAVKQYYRSDDAGAEIAFKRALELSPNYAMAHHWYGGLLSSLGRFEEAMIQKQQAFELEPLSPVIGETLGHALIDAGQYEEGLAQYERLVGLFPTNGRGYYGIGRANWTVFAQLDKAVSWLSQAVKRESGDPNLSALFGLLYLDLGDVARAEYWLKQSIAVGAVRTWPNVGMAMLYTYRDEDDQALQSANRAVQAIPVHGLDRWGRQLAFSLVRSAELKADRAAEARAFYQTHYPALLNNNEAVIDYTNYRQAIDLALVLIRTGEQDRADDLLDHSLAFVQDMFRLGFVAYGIADVQIYALQGKTDAALTTLRQAIDEGWRLFWWYYAKHDPNLDSIRDEPEFPAMMEEIRADMTEQLARVQEWVANGELAPIPKSLK